MNGETPDWCQSRGFLFARLCDHGSRVRSRLASAVGWEAGCLARLQNRTDEVGFVLHGSAHKVKVMLREARSFTARKFRDRFALKSYRFGHVIKSGEV